MYYRIASDSFVWHLSYARPDSGNIWSSHFNISGFPGKLNHSVMDSRTAFWSSDQTVISVYIHFSNNYFVFMPRVCFWAFRIFLRRLSSTEWHVIKMLTESRLTGGIGFEVTSTHVILQGPATLSHFPCMPQVHQENTAHMHRPWALRNVCM